MNLYRVTITDVQFFEDYIENVGSIYTYVDYDLAVIAETRYKARKITAEFLRNEGAKSFDWRDPMSIRKQNETILEPKQHGLCWFWGSCAICAKSLIVCECTDAEIDAWEAEHLEGEVVS